MERKQNTAHKRKQSRGTPGITQNTAVQKLINDLDLEEIPLHYLYKLEEGQTYDIQQIHRRMTALKVVSCTLYTFRQILDCLPGFEVTGNKVKRK